MTGVAPPHEFPSATRKLTSLPSLRRCDLSTQRGSLWSYCPKTRTNDTATRLTGGSAKECRPFAASDERALASVDLADGRSGHSRALGDFVQFEAAPLGIIEAQSPPFEPRLEDAVLFTQERDDVALLVSKPTAQRCDQELEGEHVRSLRQRRSTQFWDSTNSKFLAIECKCLPGRRCLQPLLRKRVRADSGHALTNGAPAPSSALFQGSSAPCTGAGGESHTWDPRKSATLFGFDVCWATDRAPRCRCGSRSFSSTEG